ncbi:MAG TPA: DUF3267 domain-containing protein [Puia sp.]|nr:DUF3267 domain-containing protein [Puia sp.]
MNLKPEELEEKGYVLLDEMSHEEIKPFVKKYITKGTWYSSIYYSSVLLSFSFVIFFCVKLHHSGNYSIGRIFLRMSLGVLLTFALVPFHELIHGVAYKLLGAKNTSYDVHLKKFYFLAIADKFVTGRREFVIIALAPFLIISLALLMALFLTGDPWKITLFTTLLIHSIACSGDFALLSYFEFNKNKNVVTYDDKEKGVSFFFGLENK